MWSSRAGHVAPCCFFIALLLSSCAAMKTSRMAASNAVPWENSEWLTRRPGTNENIFRGVFSAPAAGSGPVNATLFVSGIGAFRAYVNGVSVSENRLEPGTTDFAKLSLFARYDVSHMVGSIPASETGVIAVELGNGWYGMPTAYNANPKLRAVLVLCTDDCVSWGTSSGSWKVSEGPIIYDDIYNGESYDESMEQPGWMLSNFSAASWRNAMGDPTFNPILQERTFPPIKVNETLAPVKSWYADSTTRVIDFGREISGVVEIIVQGTHGSIGLHHGEILDHYVPGRSRFVYFKNLRTARAFDNFTMTPSSADRTIIYEPTFTYHGFRFVQVNTTGDMQLMEIRAKAFFTAVKPIAKFNSNADTLNTLHQHILWGQTANLMSYPSDCDQRDERLGWMADGWLSADEAAGNFDMQAFYVSWLRTIELDQLNGEVTDVSPFVRFGNRPADPTWGLALPWVTRVMLREYNDLDTVSARYNGCAAWARFLISKVEKSGLEKMYAYYGDWVPPAPAKKVSNSFVSAVSFLHTLNILSQLATAIGNNADAKYFSQQFAQYKPKFNDAFYNNGSASYDIGGVQSTIVLPMSVPGLVLKPVAFNLIDMVERRGFHLDTGIVGLRFLFDSISNLGRAETVLAVVMQTTYPSYAWEWSGENETAATTLWEVWNAPDQGPGMNSRNHIMDGSVDTWIRAHVGGVGQMADPQVMTMSTASVTPTASRTYSAPSETVPLTATATLQPSLGASVANVLSPVTTGSGSRLARRGIYSYEWMRHGGSVVAESRRKSPLRIDCGTHGGAIENVSHAIFSAKGETGIWALRQAAPSPAGDYEDRVKNTVKNSCVGKAKCELQWSDLVSSAPNRQHLAVIVQCSKHTAYTVSVRAPHAGTVARIPRGGVPSATLQHNGENPTSASFKEVKRDSKDVVVSLDAGHHSFVVQENATATSSKHHCGKCLPLRVVPGATMSLGQLHRTEDACGLLVRGEQNPFACDRMLRLHNAVLLCEQC